METIGDRIRKARKDKGLTQKQLADQVGVSRAAVTQWESGETKGLKPENLFAVANVLGVSAEWLGIGSGAQQGRGLTIAERPTRKIPVISTVQAGHPTEVVDAYSAGAGMEEVDVTGDIADKIGKHTFALYVDGDSMAPVFSPGDLVVVDPDRQPKPGDIVIAKLDREEAATLKKYRPRGHDDEGNEVFELVPLNEDWPTLRVDAKNPGRVIGVVVEHRRRLI